MKLFSKIIRKNFGFEEKLNNREFRLINDELNININDDNFKEYYFEELNFNSHILIITRNDNKNMKAILDGQILFDDQVFCMPQNFFITCNSIHKKGDEVHESFSKFNKIDLAHKMDEKTKKPINLFHGFIYSLCLYNDCFELFELNEFYRMLRRHRDWHVRDLIARSLSNDIYEKEPYFLSC